MRATILQPPGCFLRTAFLRERAAEIHPVVCYLLVVINVRLAHGVPNSLHALVRFSAHYHFLNFAGALFDHGLLASFRHFELALAQRVRAAPNFTGYGASFHDDALVPEPHLLFYWGLDDIS